MQTTPKQNPAEQSFRDLFGEYPEDVISPMKDAADALSWLEELFNTIKAEAVEGGFSGYRIKNMAEMGAYIAHDIGSLVGCHHDTMMGGLRKALAESGQGRAAE